MEIFAEDDGLRLPQSEEAAARRTSYSSSSIIPIPYPFPRRPSDVDSRLNDSSQQVELGGTPGTETTQTQRSITLLSSSLYSPKSCPICLEEYKVGEEIAWSKNDQCAHAFHLDCALDWLMDHDECPVCREGYLA